MRLTLCSIMIGRPGPLGLLKLFELERDPYVANSLGYIYYSDRFGSPDYEKAFYYFDYAAGDGVVEATYKLSRAEVEKTTEKAKPASQKMFRAV